jgi:signal transduction histidine kinase
VSVVVYIILVDIILAAIAAASVVRYLMIRQRQHAFQIKLITIFTATDRLHELLERVSFEIRQQLHAQQVSFLVQKTDGHIVSGGSEGYIKPTSVDAAAIETYVSHNGRKWLFATELGRGSDMQRLLKSYRIDIVIPLVHGSDIVGLLLVGAAKEHRLGLYDMQLLRSIAGELAIALQNAASLEVIKEMNGQLQQRITAAVDELQHSNNQLHDLDKAKEEFVSLASHQLRTPLTSVKGYISMVLEGDAGKITKVQRQLLSEAFTSSERMVRLINDFLNVSRIQTGKFLIDPVETDLVKVVRQEVEALQSAAKARGIKLKTVVPPNPVVLSLDEEKIRQVIMNFIDNALYYSKAQTETVVSLSVSPREARLEVRDQGIGVPMKQQAQLFTKFFRADNARKQRPDGTGVGLYLAKKVIDSHGGKLIFSSTEGKGSTFGFKLPRELAVKQPNNANKTEHDQHDDANDDTAKTH